MDLFEFGIKNRHSSSGLKRAAANTILEVEKKKADLYETYLDHTSVNVSKSPAETKAMFEKICEKIKNQETE